MYCTRKIYDDLIWVGADDRRLACFEGVYGVPDGVSYNSYLLLDEKTVLFDTVDKAVYEVFFENVAHELGGRKLDYLVISHMEPDHAATIDSLLLRYPETRIICNAKVKTMLAQFFQTDWSDKIDLVKEGDVVSVGRHQLTFVMAPMVHWPEVMMTYDLTDKTLFTADAFGTFGALNGRLFNDEADFFVENIDEARRYYTNIVGKYGPQVMALLKKAGGLDIKYICPLHGPVWRKDIGYILDKYVHWASYKPEENGVMIVYASMYGNTENAAEILAAKLAERGITNTRLYDVSSTHVSYLISDLFKYSHLVLASVTYNLGIFPPMHNFLADMKALNLQNRTVAIMENGSWAIRSGALMKEKVEALKHMTILNDSVTLASSLREQNIAEVDALADAIAASIVAS